MLILMLMMGLGAAIVISMLMTTGVDWEWAVAVMFLVPSSVLGLLCVLMHLRVGVRLEKTAGQL
jgi:hypothetical protein